MRRFTLCLLAAIVLPFSLVWAGPPAKVLYVANEGFLIEIGSKKILIDALFDDETITYAHVPDSQTLERMQSSLPPFDDIDLVLVTHYHRDHFGIGPVFQHFSGRAGGVLVGPPQMVGELKIVDPDFEVFGNRVREIDLEIFDSEQISIDGIDLQIFKLPHSAYMETDPETGKERNRHANVENLIYLVEVDGVRFVHVGDAVLSQDPEFFDDGGFPKTEIDIAFLEYFDWSDETRAILDEWMTPDHIVFMHLPPNKEKIAQLTQHLQKNFPEGFLFVEPLQVKEFSSAAGQ